MSLLSVIVPAYNEKENIQPLCGRVREALESDGIDYELLLVDDGSRDGTFSEIERCAKEDARVRGACFTRNFGKEAAISAGIALCRGDCAVVMDGDLQHPAQAIPRMYRLWQDGYEIVEGVKNDRGEEKKAQKLFARTFYALISRLTHMDMQNTSDFKLMDRRVLEVLKNLPEHSTFFRGLTFWTGFRMTKVGYDVAPRLHGSTKWSFHSLVRYAINNITNFSSAPLRLITLMGNVMLLLSFALIVQSLYKYFTHQAAEGFTTVILLLLLIGGLITTSLGIIGHYISKIYDEVKARPKYLISRQTEAKDGSMNIQ